MLVSACRKIVSATSAVLCGFLFALRAYLCERLSSSSFRPLHPSFRRSFLFSLPSSPTLVSFSPFSSSSSLSRAIIAVDALLLRNAPNDPLQPINLSQIAVATCSSPEDLFRTVKANSNVNRVYFDSWGGGNSNALVFTRIR